MIHDNRLVSGNTYWYVYIPKITINLQNVKLEKVYLDLIDDDRYVFTVYRYEKNKEFLTLDLVVEKNDTKTYKNIFLLDEKEEAEMFWTREFFKNFKQIHGIDFSHFVGLYKKVQKEHPEWIL